MLRSPILIVLYNHSILYHHVCNALYHHVCSTMCCHGYNIMCWDPNNAMCDHIHSALFYHAHKAFCSMVVFMGNTSRIQHLSSFLLYLSFPSCSIGYVQYLIFSLLSLLFFSDTSSHTRHMNHFYYMTLSCHSFFDSQYHPSYLYQFFYNATHYASLGNWSLFVEQLVLWLTTS